MKYRYWTIARERKLTDLDEELIYGGEGMLQRCAQSLCLIHTGYINVVGELGGYYLYGVIMINVPMT